MKSGVSVPNVGDPAALVAFARHVEQEGWDGYFLWDGFQHQAEAELATLDPWVLLGAVAAATDRMLLGTGVTPVCRRSPWKLAKEIITLDHLSDGRAMLGVGLGHPFEDEFAAFGDDSPLNVRASRTDEALGLLDLLLRGEPVDFDGAHYRVHAHLRPAARQSPRPPIWIAATAPHRKPLTRARRWDGVFCNWNPQTEEPLTPTEVADYTEGINGGLDIVTFRNPNYDPAEYEQVGVTWLLEIPWPEGDNWLDEFQASLPELPNVRR